AVICYNDYGLESDDVSGQRKRAAVLAMLRDLQSRHIPIGALGIQSHLKAGPHPAFGPGLAAFIRDVKSLGLKVYITELDVDDSSVPMESRPMAVAALYKRYLSLVLEAGVAA
ncbi:endo-1,4-beta-xylanase, partial [Pantoea ananatis]